MADDGSKGDFSPSSWNGTVSRNGRVHGNNWHLPTSRPTTYTPGATSNPGIPNYHNDMRDAINLPLHENGENINFTVCHRATEHRDTASFDVVTPGPASYRTPSLVRTSPPSSSFLQMNGSFGFSESSEIRDLLKSLDQPSSDTEYSEACAVSRDASNGNVRNLSGIDVQTKSGPSNNQGNVISLEDGSNGNVPNLSSFDPQTTFKQPHEPEDEKSSENGSDIYVAYQYMGIDPQSGLPRYLHPAEAIRLNDIANGRPTGPSRGESRSRFGRHNLRNGISWRDASNGSEPHFSGFEPRTRYEPRRADKWGRRILTPPPAVRMHRNRIRPIRGRSTFADTASAAPRPITKQNGNWHNATVNSTQVRPVNESQEWANAPEFVPRTNSRSKNKKGRERFCNVICPYIEKNGECKFPDGDCIYLHGNKCEICNQPALHPNDENQRKDHHKKCFERAEREKEIAAAVDRSKEKACGICFEVVSEKEMQERRFGVLNRCNHCFCLQCIRRWRKARNFDNRVVRSCPECRTPSDFVCPSVYWVDTPEEKAKLIENYKTVLSQKQCKYFRQGRGRCPFGNRCFYLHALPDGTRTDVGPPARHRRRRCRLHNQDVGDILQQIILFDVMDEPGDGWYFNMDADIEDDFVSFLSDSEDSDWSEYEILLD